MVENLLKNSDRKMCKYVEVSKDEKYDYEYLGKYYREELYG